MTGDCGRRGLYIWKASDLTPEVISPGQLKVHVCFQQQLCKLLLPRLCRAYVKIPQRQCPLCEPVALQIPGNSNPSFKEMGLKWHSHRKQMYSSLCLRQHSFHHEKENIII